jgi:hypothetical protein
MTVRGVERTARPACRLSTGPADDSTPMPPHSQGAERLQERHGGRTGSRWGLRALVVGGLAGAAWLLSGAAAQAADQDLVPGVLSAGQPVLGAVTDGAELRDSDVLPVVHRVIRTAEAAAEETTEATAEDVVAAIPLRIVPIANEAGDDSIVRDLTAPDRLAGEAVDSRPLRPAAPPVTELPQVAAEPAPIVPGTGEPDPEPRVTSAPDQPEASVTPVRAKPARVLRKDSVRAKVGKTVIPHRTAVMAAERVTVRETPGGDGPAPLRARLGAASGFLAAGQGTATDGGASAAVLPATVTSGEPASRRLPITTDAEARRHDAEAPTASPD